ncbi:putative oxidoreductase [Arthrobacter globiformis NBRC 12137]|uniref:Putative oxidoreductase n=1 Tax=Arthrobacter globiformis (strain ATCC 8010 / DSM 20124 / JCM 1332 / NBRC 12137 / NCIMB 8907 / NRRL B-2979 / 168) TaxID=1077972 RepID=H0QLP5_ARTG1|nr:FAD-dependent oxidoreductase [Arthrobacter globiformis]GAB13746.1 putative oxidoreductase [Arthrobacter globiformis NBRC 12137]
MTSLWLDRTDTFTSDPFTPGESFDTVVVGAGLTGLTTALLLARSGQDVLVLEARGLGAVATGNTTAKVTLLQGTVLSALRQQYPQKVVDAYVSGNREGQAWLLRYLEQRGVPFQLRDAYTYATTTQGTEAVRAELVAALSADLEVDYVRDAGLPFPVRGAVRLRGQAQINPMDVLTSLAEDVRSHGGRIVTGVRVRNVTGAGPSTIHVDRGSVQADSVVLATGSPILNRGLYFAKLKPNRSYAAALELTGDATPPEGMYLSVEQPVRSLRDYPADGRNLLLVGGNGHPVGKAHSEQAHLEDVLSWARQHFPVAAVTHTWSAQDYQATNLMPFFGKFPRGRGRIFFATGYNKWGMTNAVAASLGIAADILGGHLPWANTIHRRVTSPPGAASAVTLNAGVAATLAKDWGRLKKLPPADGAVPAEGTGTVALRDRKPVATSTVNGTTCSLSAVCTHLGGILHWNDNEKSWDCPLHGSRFSSDGQVLEGPATRDLPPAG